jgi:predicted oxidoreductase
MDRYNKSLAREAVAEYVKIAERYGITPTELALAWCKQQWCVTSTIIGATSMEQLKVCIMEVLVLGKLWFSWHCMCGGELRARDYGMRRIVSSSYTTPRALILCASLH